MATGQNEAAREVEESTSPEVLKEHGDVAPRDVVCGHGGVDLGISEVLPNLHDPTKMGLRTSSLKAEPIPDMQDKETVQHVLGPALLPRLLYRSAVLLWCHQQGTPP